MILLLIILQKHKRSRKLSLIIAQNQKQSFNKHNVHSLFLNVIIITSKPLSCGSDLIYLTAMEIFILLMKMGLYAFLLKFMQFLLILMAQIEL